MVFRVDEATLAIHTDVDFHPEGPMLAFSSLVHILVSVLLFNLNEALGGDQGRTNNRALFHRHTVD